MKIIDADAFRKLLVVDKYGQINTTITKINIAIDKAKVEAEPVVHCKDCRHAHMTYGGECKYCDAWEEEGEMYLDGDFYCAFGERREDG